MSNNTLDMSNAVPMESALDVFNTKRSENEIDLVTIINRDLETFYNKDATLCFINDGSIQTILDLNHISQRVIINKWFTSMLLQYRANFINVDVSEILMYVSNNSTVDTWIEFMQTIIIPFFKLNNVLNLKGE